MLPLFHLCYLQEAIIKNNYSGVIQIEVIIAFAYILSKIVNIRKSFDKLIKGIYEVLKNHYREVVQKGGILLM